MADEPIDVAEVLKALHVTREEWERVVPPSDAKSSTANYAVFGFCELLGLVFGLPPGDDLYHGAPVTARMVTFLGIGCFFAVLGPLWPLVRTWFPRRWSSSLVNAATDFRYWLALLLVGIVLSYLAPALTASPSGHTYLVIDTNYEGKPLGFAWKDADIGVQQPANPTGTFGILYFSLPAKNTGTEEINLRDAYIVSGVTGNRLRMKVNASPDGWIYVGETAPVPPNAAFVFSAQFGDGLGIPEAEFLRDWESFSVVVEFDGGKARYDYNKDFVHSQLDRVHPERSPHVSKRKP